MCLAQGHITVMLVRLEPAAPWSLVKHSTTMLPPYDLSYWRGIKHTSLELLAQNLNHFTQILKCSNLQCRSRIYNKIKLCSGPVSPLHLQCVDNHDANFIFKGMKTDGVTDYTNLAPTVMPAKSDSDTMFCLQIYLCVDL